MSNYTPPSGDSVDFSFSGSYVPPSGDGVDFYFGIVAIITIDGVSDSNIYDDMLKPGFNTSVIKWHSSVDGAYRIEMGGTGVNTGDLIDSGETMANFVITTEIKDTNIENASSFSGDGSYRFNIYVKSSDDIWTPYNQS